MIEPSHQTAGRRRCSSFPLSLENEARNSAFCYGSKNGQVNLSGTITALDSYFAYAGDDALAPVPHLHYTATLLGARPGGMLR
ncbi:TPA: hypothetical protein EYO57_23660 [Candidatus Poribacteria bacterium]|nr:hypothetical protein [Candidatus Poribacteria bacterium]